MKTNIIRALLAVLLLPVGMGAAQSQAIVSTTPQNRNAVIEDFNGKNCMWDPAAHKIIDNVIAAHPGRVVAMNIHQGYYANGNPNYRTAFGDALADQAVVSEYPGVCLNRHVYSGTTMLMDRSTLPSYVNTLLSEASPVNIAATAEVDWNTRVLTVYVELYYTGNSAASTNMLNVALIQDGVYGPQSGGSTNYPDMMVDANTYIHNHMLRHLLTGQWGDEISTTTAGSFVSRTYTYALSDSIGAVDIDGCICRRRPFGNHHWYRSSDC